jgi:hypothetical protein
MAEAITSMITSDGKKPDNPVFIGRARIPAPTRFPVMRNAKDRRKK